ncbi:uncharacterized protein N7515_000254 [Penicillium bovifimosum]|uniref:Zn(2)-C6 fungal-type domain-containing protein n=1 Tax=Penicillium bovifimosum TaxID=126998 RepID=A0A9W9LB99_9EURO|nr:uncharacterized protein N7515_000254 [Penicillium bovifimosum]KAJ5145690.1 hypothetical protein N7515_000254 [Penicillium bovifimosum]
MATVGSVQDYISTHQLADYSISDVGWITAVLVFLTLFLGVQVGPLFDTYGPRVLLICGSLASFACYMLLAECTQYWHFMLCLGILGGVSSAVITTVSISVLSHWFYRRRALASGICMAGSSTGGAIIPLLLRTLFQKYDWLWAIRIIAFMALGCYALGVLLVKGRLPPSSKKRVAIDIRALASPRLCFLATAVFSFEFIIFGCAALLPTYVRYAKFSEDIQFYSLTLLNAMSLFGRVLPGFAADQVGRFNILLRIKCDEHRPSCLRCVASKRICEGYPTPLQHSLSPDSLNDEERRAFLFFRSRTSRQIFGYRDVDAWLSTLLQLGHCEMPIKHALTALASLHESLEPVDSCVSIRRSKKHAQIAAQVLALKHYTSAIKSVQTETPDMSSRPDVTMTLCLLFICFEQFRSGDAACLIHLTAGLKLIYWWRQHTNVYSNLREYCRPARDLINDQITPVLQRLRVQFSLCRDSRHALRDSGVPLYLPPPTIPSSYSSLDNARKDYDRAMNYVFSFLERDQPADSQSPQQTPITVLRQWKAALDHSDFSAEPPMIEECTHKLLELYYHVSTVIIETYGAESESVFDSFTERFQVIVDLAESITKIWKIQSQDFNILFSFDLGITPPMFFVASRCRHGLIRRKAVDLMLHSPFYHGAWQDRYSGLCAQRMIEIEEENIGAGVDDINVEESRRIRKISADLQENGLEIVMQFTRWPFVSNSPVHTTSISVI